MAAAPEGPVGAAVSGGGDSVALLLMLRRWGERTGRTVAAVTVDHGLRAGSADEARAVAALCARVGVAARHPGLERLGRPRQPAGPGARGAARADRRLGARRGASAPWRSATRLTIKRRPS